MIIQSIFLEVILFRLQDQIATFYPANIHFMAGLGLLIFITSFFLNWTKKNIYPLVIAVQIILIISLGNQLRVSEFTPFFSYTYLFETVFVSLFFFEIIHLVLFEIFCLILLVTVTVITDSYGIELESYLVRYVSTHVLISLMLSFRIRTGKKLREKGKQFTNLFMQLGDAALYINEDQKIELINNYLSKLSQFPKDDLSGKSANELLPGVTGLLFSSQEYRQKIESETLQLVRKDDSRVPVRMIATPIFNDDLSSGGFICLIADISVRKAEEDKLRAYSSQLSSAKTELEQFSRFASHDLKAPLGTIAKYTQLLKKGYSDGQPFDEKAQKWLDTIIDDANRMDLLIDALMSYTGSGEEYMDQNEVNMNDVLEAAKSNLATSIEESKAIINIPERLPTVFADRNQMVRLMQNLIGNAITYRSQEQPEITITSKLNDSTTAHIFAVEDNGIGIDGKYYDKVFRLFQRLHSREYPGFGIGLAICKKIVDNHHGKIWLKSIKGRGTTVYFSVPISQKEAKAYTI